MLTPKEFQQIHGFHTPEALYVEYVAAYRQQIDILKKELLTKETEFIKLVSSQQLIEDCKELFKENK